MGILGFLLGGPLGSIVEDKKNKIAKSFVDNVFKDKVFPKLGSMVYCNLGLIAGPNAEHTGIYVGDGSIVHLDGSGFIELVDSGTFLSRLGGLNAAISIYVSSNNGISVGSKVVAKRALSQINTKRNYNLVLDNCHQFTSGCLTGNFENSDNFFWMVKDTAKKILDAHEWRVWDI